jgi:hypothetical protein
MRDFSWSYFEETGAIDAYLLYKEHENIVKPVQDQESTFGEEKQKLAE